MGPDNSLRGKSPHSPGAGVAKAAGLITFRSLFRYGSTPAIRLGLRMLRELPPPGVFATATKPVGRAGKAVPNVGRFATKPLAKDPPAPLGHPAAAWHWTTTSGRTTSTSTGTPLRAFRMPPISQPPSIKLPVPPKSQVSP